MQFGQKFFFFQETIVSEEHLLSSPLWQNSLIRIQNKPAFYKDWLVKGITQVKHLMDESSNFFSLTAFQIKYNLQVEPLTFFGLISAVNRLRRQNTKTQLKYENRFSNLSTKKLCKKTVKGQFHVKKSGAKTSIFRQRKLLIGRLLIKHPINAQRAVNLSLSTSNCYIAGYQLTVS